MECLSELSETAPRQPAGERRRHQGPPPVFSAALLLCTIALTPVMAHGQAVSESTLKAAFLYNFAKFVQWPAAAFRSPSAPLLLCTYQSNKIGSALKDIVKEKTIHGRSLAVKEIEDISQSKGCQVLFVGKSAGQDEESILAKIRRRSILVVGETPDFAREGGAINFVIRDNRLRFVVNLSATDMARLKLSSKLLSLAILAGT